jgi:hypothetical protein
MDDICASTSVETAALDMVGMDGTGMCSRAATHLRPSATWSSKRRERVVVVLRMEAVSPPSFRDGDG